MVAFSRKQQGNSSFWAGRRIVFIGTCLLGVIITTLGTYHYLRVKHLKEIAAANSLAFSELFRYFGEMGLIPIVRPGSHSIGDVYDSKTGAWINSRINCFPALEIGAATPSVLPSIKTSSSESSAIALGLGDLISSSALGKEIRSAQIIFENVSVASVSQHDLIAGYVESKCPELKPIMNGVKSGIAKSPDGPVLLVIREVYSAKRKVVFELSTDEELDETVKGIKREFSGAGNLEVSSSGGFSFTMLNTDVLPIAALPAFVPVWAGAVLGTSDNLHQIWLPFAPEDDTDSVNQFKELMSRGRGGGAEP
ncbi:hypothetical protein GR198_20575 [Rhizobium leguminosarum]|uniref:hypothetical protein n=1 Tax=Rhizobium leguminosarum TaxID=384 RepID=UPI0013C0FB08|nr:hypothetical protein [Rhizobium leguminosarum]NEH58121.1 hypothetical protein [Rhizobium leguminosarum]